MPAAVQSPYVHSSINCWSRKRMVLQADVQQAAAAERQTGADAGPGNNGRREEAEVQQPDGTAWMADQIMKPPPDEG
jgi:hypothetical protein